MENPFATTIPDVTRAEIARVEKWVAERDDALNVPRVSAEFLHAVVLAGGYRRALEIGTSYGYSGLWIGSAVAHHGGELVTIEMSSAKSAFARDAFRQAGLGDTVAVLEGRAEDLLRTLDGPFDFVFLDAEKAATRAYFDLVWPHLAQRATIITDNVTSHAGELAGFVQFLRGHPGLCSTLVPIGSGLELTVKLDPYPEIASLDGADWVI